MQPRRDEIRLLGNTIRLIGKIDQLSGLTDDQRRRLRHRLVDAAAPVGHTQLDLNDPPPDSPDSQPSSPPIPPPNEDAHRRTDEEVAAIMAGISSFPMDTPIKVEDE